MTVPSAGAEIPDGRPRALPFFLVDASGNPVTSTNGLPISVTLSATSIAIEDGTTASQKLAVDASGRLTLVPNQVMEIGDGTTPTQKLAIDASGRLTLVPNQTFELVDSAGTNKLAIDASGRITLVPNQTVEIVDSAGTNKLAVDASGRLTLIPNSSVNHAQVAGTTTSVNSGTSDAGTQRIINAGAATGTKTNVGGSASSTTILASNTSRKGAMVYNDSTALLYLDLSGGTASSSSYSVQLPAQSFFELPGPTIYNGAITGIWASATGNARITEFS